MTVSFATPRSVRISHPQNKILSPDQNMETTLLHPLDLHNEQLLQNVHPPQWTNPQPASRYHLVVIGAGTAGLVTAASAGRPGARAGLIERHLLGGDAMDVWFGPS